MSRTGLKSTVTNLLVTTADMAAELGVSRQRVHELRLRKDFPAPLGTVGNALVWARSDFDRWAAAWARRAGRPPAPKD